MTREETLNTAADAVLRDRTKTHGAPEKSFGMISAFWSAYLSEITGAEIDLAPHEVAEMMELLKIARAANNPKNADNYADAAGYAACACELATEGVF